MLKIVKQSRDLWSPQWCTCAELFQASHILHEYNVSWIYVPCQTADATPQFSLCPAALDFQGERT